MIKSTELIVYSNTLKYGELCLIQLLLYGNMKKHISWLNFGTTAVHVPNKNV